MASPNTYVEKILDSYRLATAPVDFLVKWFDVSASTFDEIPDHQQINTISSPTSQAIQHTTVCLDFSWSHKDFKATFSISRSKFSNYTSMFHTFVKNWMNSEHKP